MNCASCWKRLHEQMSRDSSPQLLCPQPIGKPLIVGLRFAQTSEPQQMMMKALTRKHQTLNANQDRVSFFINQLLFSAFLSM